MKFRLQNLQRIYKQAIMLFVDFLILIFSLWFSFVLRLGEPFPLDFIYSSLWLFIVLPAIMLPLFVKLGLYRAVLQYMGVKVITTTFQATTIACLIVGFLMMNLGTCQKNLFVRLYHVLMLLCLHHLVH